MRSEPPDDDAYGRVTNPERFLPAMAAARELIDYLVLTYEVDRTTGTAAVDFPRWRDASAETVRLVPRSGTPLVFLFTDFPGVMVQIGEWGNLPEFPNCGCDACDESAEEVAEELDHLVSSVVNGNYAETLTKRELSYGYRGAWGSRSSRLPLRRGEWKVYGEPETHSWPPWPKREP